MKKYTVFLIAVTGLIIAGAVINPGKESAIMSHSGYPLHLVTFFIATFIAHTAFVKLNRELPLTTSVLYSAMLALWIEIIQKFVPNRNFDLVDAVFGVAGALTYASIAFSIRKVKSRYKK